MTRSPISDRGFALLIVLWSLVLIALLTTQLLAGSRTALHLAANLRDAAVAQASADGAINQAVFHLLAEGNNGWQPDGTPHVLVVGGLPVTVLAISLASKINPNLASTPLLAGLFQACGASDRQSHTIADAIIAWRSNAVSPQAAQDRLAAYRQANLPYGPPAHGFDDLAQLSNVAGIPPALLAAALPHMNLYQSTDPDPKLTDPIVLQALTISGQTGSSSTQYNGANPVVQIDAEALGPSHLAIHRHAIVSLAGPGTPQPYEFIALY